MGEKSFGSLTAFEDMTPDEQAAWVNQQNAQLEQIQQDALSRLPEFSGEDRESQIVNAYRFIFGLTQMRTDALRPSIFAEVLADLDKAFPDVLTQNKVQEIWAAYPDRSSNSTAQRHAAVVKFSHILVLPATITVQ